MCEIIGNLDCSRDAENKIYKSIEKVEIVVIVERLELSHTHHVSVFFHLSLRFHGIASFYYSLISGLCNSSEKFKYRTHCQRASVCSLYQRASFLLIPYQQLASSELEKKMQKTEKWLLVFSLENHLRPLIPTTLHTILCAQNRRIFHALSS